MTPVSSPPRLLTAVKMLGAALGGGLLLAGCPGAGELDPLDQDHDGWIAPQDCDDLDPLVSPDESEVCDGIDNDCNGEVDEEGALDAGMYYDDRDADGWGDEAAWWRTCTQPAGTVAQAGDCEDGDAAVGPDQDELCDGIDNDCDGLTDEADATDTIRYHLDADGDGWGTAGVYQDACDPPDGHVADATDCDDSDALVNPGALEVCDPADVDEDCNGVADDLDALADGLTAWYPDGDGDGFGLDADLVSSCEPPAYRAERAGDCDDADDGVHPDAAELCANGVDDDCDGALDGADGDHLGLVALYGDGDGDGYGSATDPRGTGCDLSAGLSSLDSDCDDDDPEVFPGAVETWYDGLDQDCAGDDDDDADGDGVAAELSGGGDCDDLDPLVLPGAQERCTNGVDDDCDGAVDPCAPWTFEGEEGSQAGGAVAGAGDVDGDGWPDLLVGGELAGDANQGAAWLLSGPVSAGETVAWTGGESGQHAGAAVAGLGDLDGDGYGEVLIGAPGADLGGGTGSGGAWLLAGPSEAGSFAELAAAVLVGEDGEDEAGAAVAGVGDVDGDGWPDLLLGAPEADPSGLRTGAAYLLRGPLSGTIDLWYADAILRGEAAGDQAGAAVAGAGDVDGDGRADLLVGAPNRRGEETWAGAAYLVSGPAEEDLDLGEAAARLWGAVGSDQAGAAVAGAGDVDGDGYDDVLIGAPENDLGGSSSGAAWLLRGPLSGEVALASADLVLVGATAGDRAGSSVAGGFDLDGDGATDLAVGASADDRGGSDAGAVYVALDPGSGTLDLARAALCLEGDEADLALGSALAAPGDVSADGAPDLVVGVPHAGRALVIAGW